MMSCRRCGREKEAAAQVAMVFLEGEKQMVPSEHSGKCRKETRWWW